MSQGHHHLRCYVHPRRWRDGRALLDPESRHHLVDVLRAADGDEVELFDGAGRVARALLETAHGAEPCLRILDESVAGRRGPFVTLVQAIPKGRIIDSLVEKATELGVGAIRPVISSRVIARPNHAQRIDRRARWERIALSAARQCRTPWVPSVYPVVELAEALHEVHAECNLMLAACLSPVARPLTVMMDAIRANACAHVALLIGPEGDWSEDEVQGMMDAGAQPVTFGRRVLRVETAALYGLSVLAYEGERYDPAEDVLRS